MSKRKREKRRAEDIQLLHSAQALAVFPNADKKDHETWASKGATNIMNFPCPFRMILSGPPNSGKTSAIHNIVLFQEPPFEEVEHFWLCMQ